MIHPFMVVGVGIAGVLALDEIAHHIRQAYGESVSDSLSLMGFAVPRSNTPPDPWVRLYPAFDRALSDWLSKAEKEVPALAGWFDSVYYTRTDVLPRLDNSDDRQLVRARFIRHLSERGGALRDFVRKDAHRLSQTVNAGETLPVYLLADLDDPASALVLDISNLLTTAFDGKPVTPRLMLFLALPAAWGADLSDTGGDPLAGAASFAILRELDRFTTTYGATQNMLYPIGSGLEGYNATVSAMIDRVKVYPAQPPDQMGALWADLIVPQVERRPYTDAQTYNTFGQYYEQYNLVNWKNWQIVQAEADGSRYTFYTSTDQTQTALFPLGALRQHWSARLAHTVLEEWMGVHPSDTATALRDSLLHRVWKWEDGSQTSTPLLVAHLTDGAAHKVGSWRHEAEVEQVLFRSEVERGLPSELRVITEQPGLRWTADAKTIRGGGLQRFNSATAEEIERHLAAYRLSLTTIGHIQQQRFKTALRQYLDEQLTSPNGQGIRYAYTVLTHLTTLLAEVDTALRVIVRQRTANAPDGLGALRRAATAVQGFSGIIPAKLTGPFKNYLNIANQVAAQGRLSIALEILAQTARALYEIAHEVSQSLDPWPNILWEGAGSMLGIAAAATSRPLQLPPHPNRLWLYDAAWGEAAYQREAARLSPVLRQRLIWRNKGDTWQFVIEQPDRATAHHDNAARETLTLRQVGTGLNTMYASVWQAEVAGMVESEVNLRLWHNYLLPNDTFNRRLPDLKAHMTRARALWPPTPYIVADHLILPDGSEPLRADLVEALEVGEQHLEEVHTSADPTRMVRYTTYEVFALDRLPAYTASRQAYLRLNRAQRSRLHILSAEREAVFWETEAEHRLTGRERLLLPNRLIGLLAHPAQLRLFIELEAVGLVGWHDYQEIRRYGLFRPSGSVLWLTGTRSDSPLEAATNFIFQRTPFPTGTPSAPGQAPLPDLDTLGEWVRSAVAARLEQDEPHWVEHTALKNLTMTSIFRSNPQARHDGEYAHLLWRYTMQKENQTAGNPNERAFQTLLYLIAKEMYDQTISNINKRVYY